MIFRRSLVSELANSAGAVFTVIFSIVITIGLVRILGLAAGGRIDSATVVEMVVYEALVNLAPLLSVSLFIAVLITLTRSWLDSEMVVWFSSGGISLVSWIRPVLRFSIPVIALIAVLSTVISPWARGQREMNEVMYAQRDDVSRLSAGNFIELKGGSLVLFVEEISKDGLSVKNVFLTSTAQNKEMIVVADSGQLQSNEMGDRYIILHDGRRYEAKANTAEYQVTNFKTYGLRLDVKPESALQMRNVKTMPMGALLLKNDATALGELMWRISWPLAALNLVLIAIPLSFTNPRAGRSLNTLVALLFFVFYLNAISVGKTWIEQGTLSFWASTLLLNGSFTLVALVLFLRRTVMQRWLPFHAIKTYWSNRGLLK